MNLKCDIQIFLLNILMYQVVLYQCMNLDNVVDQIIKYHKLTNLFILYIVKKAKKFKSSSRSVE
jgi:hypothetical protein